MITTHRPDVMRPPLRRPGMAVAALLLLIVATGSVAAQSTDRDAPTPLTTSDLKADFSDTDPEYFYSFTAGPGEVVFTLDVRGTGGGGGVPYIFLFNKDGKEIDSFNQIVGGGSSEKLVKRMSFAKRQTVIMRVGKHIGKGSYRLRSSGAVALGSETATNGGGTAAGSGSNPAGGGINVPSSGRLRIEMKDGSAQEFDLSRVRRVVTTP